MHDVMHAIVLYITQSVCVAHCNCASGMFNAYVCMSQLSENVKASCVSYVYTSVIHSRVLLLHDHTDTESGLKNAFALDLHW